MSYSGRKRYTSRREKTVKINRNIKMILIFSFLALIVWVIKNRVDIWDYLQTYFY